MSRERDIAYGKHSLIPSCCIRFFIDEWEAEYTRGTPYSMAVNMSKWNYVPCPKCFATGNLVVIKQCAIDCERECWKDF